MQIVSVAVAVGAQLQKARDRVIGDELRIGAAQLPAESHGGKNGLDEVVFEQEHFEKLAGGNH
jgi:hypothetical protein